MNLKAALIQLPRRNDACTKCQGHFVRGNDYFSLLIGEELTPSKKDPLQRRDFCLSCWTNTASEFTGNSSAPYWRSTIPKKAPSEEPLKKPELALNLLKASTESPKSETAPTDYELFFLALYLARKRTLLYRNVVEQPEGSYQIFEVAETEELLAIKKVDLNNVDLPALQKALADKLNTITQFT